MENWNNYSDGTPLDKHMGELHLNHQQLDGGAGGFNFNVHATSFRPSSSAMAQHQQHAHYHQQQQQQQQQSVTYHHQQQQPTAESYYNNGQQPQPIYHQQQQQSAYETAQVQLDFQQQNQPTPLTGYPLQQEPVEGTPPVWMQTMPPDLYQSLVVGQHHAILQEVQVGLEQLVGEPAEYESWSAAIAERLRRRDVTASAARRQCVTDAVRLALHAGISVPNSGYLVAKLLKRLTENEGPDGSTKTEIILPCLRNLHELRGSDCFCPDTKRNLAILLAEIFTTLATSHGLPYGILGTAVYEQIDSLLTYPQDPENLKCVVRILKCCGHELEGTSAEAKQKMDSELDTLSKIGATYPGLTNDVRMLTRSMVGLRASGWGHGQNGERASKQTSSQNKDNGADGQSSSNGGADGLYIGPDGLPLTEEELAFLDSNLGRVRASSSEDPSYSDFEADEQAEAYEKFLQQRSVAGRAP